MIINCRKHGGFLLQSDKIFQFSEDPLDEKWILREEKLQFPKIDFTAILVPDNYIKCHEEKGTEFSMTFVVITITSIIIVILSHCCL